MVESKNSFVINTYVLSLNYFFNALEESSIQFREIFYEQWPEDMRINHQDYSFVFPILIELLNDSFT